MHGDREEIRGPFGGNWPDKDHVHFLIQAVSRMSATTIITMVKSLTSKEIFKKHPEVKTKLWGGEFWTDGFFVNTVSKFGDEASITKYVRDQGLEKDYTVLYKSKQLALFLDTPLHCGEEFIEFNNCQNSNQLLGFT